MAEVFIDSLMLENFGPFYGEFRAHVDIRRSSLASQRLSHTANGSRGLRNVRRGSAFAKRKPDQLP